MFALLLVYVDDIVITSSSTDIVEHVITSINAQFKLKDLGNLNYFLGMEVSTSDDYLLVYQNKYIQEMLSKVGLSDTNGFPNSMTSTCITHIGMYTCT